MAPTYAVTALKPSVGMKIQSLKPFSATLQTFEEFAVFFQHLGTMKPKLVKCFYFDIDVNKTLV